MLTAIRRSRPAARPRFVCMDWARGRTVAFRETNFAPRWTIKICHPSWTKKELFQGEERTISGHGMRFDLNHIKNETEGCTQLRNLFGEQSRCWRNHEPYSYVRAAHGQATWKREFKLPWREAGPLNRLDEKVDSDQWVVTKELSLESR